MTETRKHTISCVVNNRTGILARVAGSFAEKGLNITSLAVGDMEEATTRMTIVVKCPAEVFAQVVAHLRDLPDVVAVEDLDKGDIIERQLMLLRVRAVGEDIARIMQLVEVFRATVAGMGRRSLTIEMSGPENKVDALISLLRPFGILEVSKTGRVAMDAEERDDATP
jgi:acetolactate synthase I/III small subunit